MRRRRLNPEELARWDRWLTEARRRIHASDRPPADVLVLYDRAASLVLYDHGATFVIPVPRERLEAVLAQVDREGAW